ncbi:hypothetical protein HDU87_001248 [Geranomyces variabilis]|uniref:Uncharacterized protein n=1 Tax=Geranomyces variabilis TaxID=109894 RepID=A0AAD5TBK0_9FUNG|nr:hypothetical protein HDU87_001248 [Geranomyces variabilis]
MGLNRQDYLNTHLARGTLDPVCFARHTKIGDAEGAERAWNAALLRLKEAGLNGFSASRRAELLALSDRWLYLIASIHEPAVPFRLQEPVTPDRPPTMLVFPDHEAQLAASFSFSARYTNFCINRFMESPVKRLAQIGRHALRKRRWAVFEAQFLGAIVGVAVNANAKWLAPTPQMHFGKVLSALEELPTLTKVVTVLRELQAEGKIVGLEPRPRKTTKRASSLIPSR